MSVLAFQTLLEQSRSYQRAQQIAPPLDNLIQRTISGWDDAHNTIPGFQESGWAALMRKLGTDFGSGFLGIRGGVIRTFVEHFLANTFAAGGGRTMAGTLNVAPTLVKQKAIEFVGQAFRHSPATRQLIREDASSLRTFFRGLQRAERSGQRGLVFIDLDEIMSRQQLKAMMAHEKVHLSTIRTGAKLTAPVGSIRKTPEYRQFVDLLTQAQYNEARVSSYPEEFIAFMRQYMMAPETLRGTVLEEPLGNFVLRYGKRRSFKGLRFSGRDDRFNFIEGLRHGGEAELKRLGLTEFRSGWDPLRSIAREIFGGGKGAFRKLLRSQEFQTALGGATLVRELGAGTFGTAHLMQATYRHKGQDIGFQFVRKTLKESYYSGLAKPLYSSEAGMKAAFFDEIMAMKKLQYANAPTVYGYDWGTRSIAMEHFAARADQTLRPAEIAQLEKFLGEARFRGVAHADILRERTNSGAADLADRIRVGAHNVIVTPEGHVGVIDWGLTSSAISRPGRYSEDITQFEWAEARVKAFWHSQAEPTIQEIAAIRDAKLVQGLNLSWRRKQVGEQADAARSASSQLVTNVWQKEGVRHLPSDVKTAAGARRFHRRAASAITLRQTQEELWANAIRGGQKHANTYASQAYGPTQLDPFAQTLLIK